MSEFFGKLFSRLRYLKNDTPPQIYMEGFYFKKKSEEEKKKKSKKKKKKKKKKKNSKPKPKKKNHFPFHEFLAISLLSEK